MLLQNILIVRQVIFQVDSPKNIAKNEQSSHTSGGSHRRLTTLNGKKDKYTNKGTDKQYVSKKFCTAQYHLSYLMLVLKFKILGKVVPEKSLTKISIFITLA